MHLRGVVGSTGPLSHIAVDSSFCLAAEKSNACRVREKLSIRLQAGVKPKIFTFSIVAKLNIFRDGNSNKTI